MPMVHAKSVGVHWHETRAKHAVSEAVVEVEHADGDRQFFTVQILRCSEKFTPEAVPQEFKAELVKDKLKEDKVKETKVREELVKDKVVENKVVENQVKDNAGKNR